jgi:hypothetical protein
MLNLQLLAPKVGGGAQKNLWLACLGASNVGAWKLQQGPKQKKLHSASNFQHQKFGG